MSGSGDAPDAVDSVAAVAQSNGAVSTVGRPVLSVRDLKVTFATPKGALTAVDSVGFDLDAGKTLGIVGESGSGKSVLARSLMGLLPDTATVGGGSVIEFDGNDMIRLRPKELRSLLGRDISMVFQDPMTSLTPVLKVGTQMIETIRLHLGLSGKEASELAVDLLKQVGISDAAERMRQYPHQLSGGMRQRLMIALAIACHPKLVIADEPTTALDVTIQDQILRLLGRLRVENEMALILVSHDLTVVMGEADEIAVMYAGRIMERGTVDQIKHHTRHPYTEALFECTPLLSNPSSTVLLTIPGLPPDPHDDNPGCPFAPRCRYAQARCHEESPELESESGSDGSVHQFACFFPLQRQLVD